MNNKTEQAVTGALRGTAAGGRAEIINVPGYPLMVRAVDYNTLRTQLAEAHAALKTVMRNAELSKEPCSPDPESPAAVRNAKFASLSSIAAQGLGMVCGPSLTEHLVEAHQDAERLDWLGNQFVTVRVPLLYGSKECFMGTPTDNDGESIPWNIRAAIDATKEEKNGA